jgi:uncharacterized Zn finger protein (UPF0148 family)
MAWQKLFDTCPKCGESLYADTSTGDVVCLECDYETGHKMPEAIIGQEG